MSLSLKFFFVCVCCIEFAEIIVAPLFQVGGEAPGPRVWDKCLQDNMKRWEVRRQKGVLQLLI